MGCHDDDDLDDDGDDNNGSRCSDQMLSRHLLYVVAALERVAGAEEEDRRLPSPGGVADLRLDLEILIEVVGKFDSYCPVMSILRLAICHF